MRDGSHVWVCDNRDSAYFKNDTIIFYNYEYAYSEINICFGIEWYFSNASNFGISKYEYCREPPISWPLSHRYKLNISKDGTEMGIKE